MTAASSDALPNRRERGKQQKLARITAAAERLFTERGMADVTTQEVADAADVGVGTLFLYARSKAELLLLVQNAHYSESVERGIRAAATKQTPIEAVMALVESIVECNRRHVDNGRAYVRELLFGDPDEPNHRIGLTLAERVNIAFAEILTRESEWDDHDARRLANGISSMMIVSLASPLHLRSTNHEIAADIRAQVELLLRR